MSPTLERDPYQPRPDGEQRDVTYYPAGEMLETIRADYIRNFLDGFRLSDIFWTREHSDDFSDTRLQYLLVRLRFMLMVFVGLVSAWILIDLFTLTWEHFLDMVIARVSLCVALLLIWHFSQRRRGVNQMLLLLAATMLVTMVFYAAACAILASGMPEMPNAGYEGIPLLALALLGLFPVTLLYSGVVMLLICISYLLVQGWFGTLWSGSTLNYLTTLFLMAGVVLWIQMGQLLMLLRLYRESTRDPLTGLINRRVLMKQLMAEVVMHQETGRQFTLMMLDLDHFKWVNDSYGHMVGDVVLQNAARLMARELRASDIIARFGGEEFVAVLPGQSREDAMPVAERIRHLFERNPIFVSSGGDSIGITTSIGITEYESGERIEVTLNRVDDNLYRAKQLGRNLVVSEVAGE